MQNNRLSSSRPPVIREQESINWSSWCCYRLTKFISKKWLEWQNSEGHLLQWSHQLTRFHFSSVSVAKLTANHSDWLIRQAITGWTFTHTRLAYGISWCLRTCSKSVACVANARKKTTNTQKQSHNNNKCFFHLTIFLHFYINHEVSEYNFTDASTGVRRGTRGYNCIPGYIFVDAHEYYI